MQQALMFYSNYFKHSDTITIGKVRNITYAEFIDASNEMQVCMNISAVKSLIAEIILSERGTTYLDRLCNSYLDTITAKYQAEMYFINDKKSLIQWIDKLILPYKYYGKYMSIFTKLELERCKRRILFVLKMILVKSLPVKVATGVATPIFNSHITPWTLANTRDDLSEALFGPAVQELPVLVHNCVGAYLAMYTENFAHGMWAFIRGKDCRMSLFNCDMHRDLPKKYLIKNDQHKCNIDIFDQRYYFDDFEFIRGLIEGCYYVHMDAREIIKAYYFYPLQKYIDIVYS